MVASHRDIQQQWPLGLQGSVAIVLVACALRLGCVFSDFSAARPIETASSRWFHPDMHLLQGGVRIYEGDIVGEVQEEPHVRPTSHRLVATSLVTVLDRAASPEALPPEEHKESIAGVKLAVAAENVREADGDSSLAAAAAPASLASPLPSLLEEPRPLASAKTPPNSLLMTTFQRFQSAFARSANSGRQSTDSNGKSEEHVLQIFIIAGLLIAFVAIVVCVIMTGSDSDDDKKPDSYKNNGLLLATGAGELRGHPFMPGAGIAAVSSAVPQSYPPRSSPGRVSLTGGEGLLQQHIPRLNLNLVQDAGSGSLQYCPAPLGFFSGPFVGDIQNDEADRGPGEPRSLPQQDGYTIASPGGSEGNRSTGVAAISDVPPPLCPVLVLPVSEARFAVPMQSLTKVDPKGFDILGLSGNPLLHAAVRRSQLGGCFLEVGMAHAHSSPRATIGPVTDSASASSGWEIHGPNGAFYGMLDSLPGGAHVVTHGGGDQTSGQPASKSAARQVMVIDGDVTSKRFTVTSGTGRALASATVSNNHFDAELLECRVLPNVDGILVLSCLLAVVLLSPGAGF